MLRSLVEKCLDDDPAMRPDTETVCETIQVTKDAYTKGFSLECIVLYQQLKQQRLENEQLRNENKQKDTTLEQNKIAIEQLRTQMVNDNYVTYLAKLCSYPHS